MIFRDRADAGIQLADRLVSYKRKKDTVVVGLPRGGVPVAYEVAKKLRLPLDVVCPRKVGAPGYEEFAIGAVTETGESLLNDDVICSYQIPQTYLEEIIEKEVEEAAKRLRLYRSGLPARDFQGKSVILIDDGLATGSTMKAAIKSARKEGAVRVIVAVPVSPPETFTEIELIADEAVCMNTPPYFQAVGQFYEEFSQTSDEEVISCMKASRSFIEK